MGAAFEVKDLLKARGYRWHAELREWRRDVRDAERSEEELWLAAHVYAPGLRPRRMEPVIQRITWRERYA